MTENIPENCPRCGQAWKAGLSARAAGLSFAAPEKFEQFAFIDEDVSKAGLQKVLPWQAEYYRSYLCRSCELYLVDFSNILNRREANREAAAIMSRERRQTASQSVT